MRPLSLPSRATLLAAFFILCAATCASQKAQEKRVDAPPTGLALEVNTKEGPIGYHSVPGAFFGGRYRRLPGWNPLAGSPQPRTFKMTCWPEGDGVRVKIFALMDRFHEQEVLLGDYLLREGEKAAVEAMRKYDYEPMEMTVVAVKSVPTLPPVATSNVPSVVVAGVREKKANFPSYVVALRNLSHKDITYLEIKTPSSAQWPRDEHNRAVLKAGEVYEVTVRGGGRGPRPPEGFTPSAPQSVVVTTAVFADESYEGDSRSATTHIAGLRGQRMQIERALDLWDDAATAGDALENFERRVQALDRNAPASLGDPLAGIAGVARQDSERHRVFFEGGLNDVRRELLKDIQEYRQARERAAESQPSDAWLRGLRKKYEDWLSRLQPPPTQ